MSQCTCQCNCTHNNHSHAALYIGVWMLVMGSCMNSVDKTSLEGRINTLEYQVRALQSAVQRAELK